MYLHDWSGVQPRGAPGSCKYFSFSGLIFWGHLVGGLSFYFRESYFQNANFGNNLSRYMFFRVFGGQIEFPKIFCIFLKIPLRSSIEGGGKGRVVGVAISNLTFSHGKTFHSH